MRTSIYFLGALLVFGVILAMLSGVLGAGQSHHAEASSHRPELEHLKAVNSVAPPQDSQLLFLLMAQYSNANLQGEGAEFLSARMKEFGPVDRPSKGALSERRRIVASPACIVGAAIAPNRLREGDDSDP